MSSGTKSILFGFICLLAGVANLPWVTQGHIVNLIAAIICFVGAAMLFMLGTRRLMLERRWRQKEKRWLS